jgi:hypothetical protein
MHDAMDGKEVRAHEKFHFRHAACDLRFWDSFLSYTQGLLSDAEWEGFREPQTDLSVSYIPRVLGAFSGDVLWSFSPELNALLRSDNRSITRGVWSARSDI